MYDGVPVELQNLKEKFLGQIQQISADHFISQNEFRRDIFAKFKTWINFKENRRRTKFAKNFIYKNSFNIPKDQGFLFLQKPGWKEIESAVQCGQDGLKNISKENLFLSKEFISKSLISPQALDLNSPILKLALSPFILESVSQYLGTAPLLHRMEVRYSRFSNNDLYKSQLYHCDTAERSQVKVFIYCSKIDNECGPLTFINAHDSAKIRKKLKYKFGGEQTYITDQEIESNPYYQGSITACGNIGDVVFIDTGKCFHMGSRILNEKSYRLVILLQYVTISGFEVPLILRSTKTPFAHLNTPHSKLSDLQRFALDGNY